MMIQSLLYAFIFIHTLSEIAIARSVSSCVVFYYSRQAQNVQVYSHPYLRLLRSLQKPFTDQDPVNNLPEVSMNNMEFPRVQAVRIHDFIKLGKKGEGYFVLKKQGQTWRSYFAKNLFDVESDPTWVISVLGPKVASFLGFRLIDESTLLAPNASLFNRRIAALNIKLQRIGYEKIYLKWVETISLKEIGDGFKETYSEAYVRRNVEEDINPFQQEEIVHDTAHHATEVLMTREQIYPIKARAQVAMKFADYLRRQLGDKKKLFPILADPRRREAIIAMMFNFLARDRDNFSGVIPQIFLAGKTPENKKYEDHFTYFRSHLGVAMDRYTIRSGLEYRLRDWFEDFMEYYLKKVFDPKLSAQSRWLDHEAINKLTKYTDKKFQGAVSEISNQYSDFRRELFRLQYEFQETYEPLNGTMVLYDENMNVLSGFVSKELPIETMERRKAEFTKAIEQ